MLRYLLCTFLLFSSFNLYAQDWNPFPLKQQSLFKIADVLWEVVEIDSLTEDNKIWFNPRISNKTCLSDGIIKEYISQVDYFLVPEYAIQDDSLILFVSKQSSNIDTFEFNPYAQPGNSRQIANTNLVLKCDSIIFGQILGKYDSLKYYSIKQNGNNKTAFVLSKNYGFIQMSPIVQLTFSDTSAIGMALLKGFRNDSSKTGTVVPNLTDIFGLHTGDVLYYRASIAPISFPPITEIYYYKDSILEASHSDSLVVYNIKRFEKGQSYTITNSHKWSIYKPFMYLNSASVVFTNNVNENQDIFTYDQIFNISLNDTSFALTFDYNGYFVANDPCGLSFIFDAGLSYEFVNKLGILRKKILSFYGYDEYEIIGGVIDGKSFGIDYIPNYVMVSKEKEIKLLPNPFCSEINIETPQKSTINYRLYSSQGIVLDEGLVMGNKILTGHLPEGLYYLMISDDDDITIKKIVKIPCH